MSNVESLLEPHQLAQLNEEMIVEYLMNHPDFFARYPDVVASLQISHQQRGAISLVELQQERLRIRISELEEEVTQFMSIASTNDRLFALLAETQQQLFTTTNLHEIDKVLTQLADKLNLTAAIVLFDAPVAEYRLDRNEYQTLKATRFPQNALYLGRLRQREASLFFDDSVEFGSAALLPLGHKQELGIMAFYSPDGAHFQPNMDTLFLAQLASVVSYLISSWSR
ncbi:DUF484 family protein [Vibrio sp. SS-MA-C1-2]|uniref:DUF484 family protein n=1 Tax=Vibrio sp. SS-MA-C1-2 TaxID=2908646 RepID=UPI001F3C144D|nr:DUF484 family protein [Vibrio sp. SS-MA-C1-2]UJF19410.1 DUF484 family protein [Vibrio sp. SS-MA-C1-2]